MPEFRTDGLSKATALAIGGAFLISTWYVAGVAALQLAAVISLHLHRPLAFNPINFFQRNYYQNGGRHIWQADPACATPDPVLIYAPRIGTCQFANVEFSTTLTFDTLGRAVPARDASAVNSTNGIAVLGDSHAMGWGVSDAETFANVLQSTTQRPVYNLAVSSYGTGRELRRLVRSGLLDRVETVVIQYSSNDVGENAATLTDADFLEASRAFERGHASVQERGLWNQLTVVYDVMKYALTDPVMMLKERALGHYSSDFSRHLQFLRKTISRYEHQLQGKQVLVFYSNEYGTKFSNFPVGVDNELRYVSFFDCELSSKDYFVVDDHLSAEGHRHIATRIAQLLKVH